jgi:adenylate cyclase
VLFADLVGGSRVAQCSQALEAATRAGGGELIKKLGEGIMASFPTPDAAAAAATQMHSALAALIPHGEPAPTLRIGFHAGPVIERDGDLFGDTVNLAARLTQHAARGQILTSRETARLLSAALRSATRALYEVEVKGKSEKVELWEVIWQQSPDITDVAEHTHPTAAARLRLKHRGRDIDLPEEGLDVGRDPGCQVVVDDEHVSRRHCTIRARQGKFLVQDHSANGTYLAIDGEPEIALHREDYVLRGHGWISFGQPRGEARELLEFFCD